MLRSMKLAQPHDISACALAAFKLGLYMTVSEKTPEETTLTDVIEAGLLQLLDHRYGDGLVYLREAEERDLLSRAIRLGLVSPDGYITPKGQAALARMSA